MNSMLLYNRKILYNVIVKITYKNYYLSAIAGVGAFRQAKRTLHSKVLIHELGIHKVSSYIRDRYLHPAVNWAFIKVGSLTSKAVSIMSPNLGHSLKEGWTDPFSSAFIRKMTRQLQGITEPLANCKPINLPVLKQISQSVIGLARLADVSLKDTSSVLGLTDRTTKIFSWRPWEAFVTKDQNIVENAVGLVALWFFWVIWCTIKVVDLSICGIQKLAHKVKVGRTLADSYRQKLKSNETRFIGFFERMIQNQETKTRKKVIKKAVTWTTRKALFFATASTIRSYLARGVVVALFGQMYFSGLTDLLERHGLSDQAHWIVDHGTVKTFFLMNLAVKVCSAAAFFREIAQDVDGSYSPSNHTIFYKKSLANGLYNLFRINGRAKKLA